MNNLDSRTHKVISHGAASGTYQAFPDVCRAANGDILVVFYAGYHHISFPNAQYPKGGRICLIRSADNGKTWSEPRVIYDDENDNRDPHIALLSDGTLICSFFTILPCAVDKIGYPTEPVSFIGVQLTRSTDCGETWEQNVAPFLDNPNWLASAPVRQLPDGTCLLGLYYYNEALKQAWGGVTISHDTGKTWGAPISIGKESGLSLPAETDVIQLKDGSLLAALRGDENKRTHLHFARSGDEGLSWSAVEDSGFFGHCPYLMRVSSGEILLTYRAAAFPNDVKVFSIGLRFSRDEGKTWQGPFEVDTVIGAYPSTLELKDGSILMVYYEESSTSGIRLRRFRLPKDATSTELEFLDVN